jgi:hypothetical protein
MGNEHAMDTLETVHGLELVVWSVCALAAAATLTHTLGVEFPARERSIVGECVVLVLSLGLGGAALRRALGERRSRARTAFAVIRMLLGAPAFLFGLIAAAAGFAA